MMSWVGGSREQTCQSLKIHPATVTRMSGNHICWQGPIFNVREPWNHIYCQGTIYNGNHIGRQETIYNVIYALRESYICWQGTITYILCPGTMDIVRRPSKLSGSYLQWWPKKAPLNFANISATEDRVFMKFET